MGILSSILGKIFPSDAASGQAAGTQAPAASAPPTPASGTSPAGTTSYGSAPVAAPVAMNDIDVEAMLDGMTRRANEKVGWRTSIVDLMKLLGLDSSLTARKELAQELHYTGDMNDSATRNIWQHRPVMTKVAANGGKLPADLKD
jgi:hypothetical protein